MNLGEKLGISVMYILAFLAKPVRRFRMPVLIKGFISIQQNFHVELFTD